MLNIHSRVLRGTCASALGLVLMTLGLAGLLEAQQANLGSLTGAVTDSTGGVVPGAKVVATNVATTSIQQTSTTSSGSYTIPGLKPGDYTVTVEKTGFETARVTAVVVFAAQEATTNVVLHVGATSSMVTVTAEGSLLTPNSAQVTHTMENELVKELPYFENDVLEAIMTVPGVTGDPASPGGVTSENPSNLVTLVIPGADIQVGGARMGSQSYLVDGNDNTGTGFAREAMVYSPAVVQEISVVTNGLPAQYGRTGGGVINMSTKSGTNAVHGELMWRHADPSLQAYQFSSVTSPQLHQNFFGIYAGGPVYVPKIYDGRNKTWFFVNVEPQRISNLSGIYENIYTGADVQGHFANDFNFINQTILASQGAAAALAAPRVAHLYYQFALNSQGFPIGEKYTNTAQYVQVPNDDISAQLALNPAAMWLMSQMPTTTNPGPYVAVLNGGQWMNNGDNAWALRGVEVVNNRWGFRIDHQFSSSDHLFVRFGREPLTGDRYNFFAKDSPAGQNPWGYTTTNDISLNEVHSFSSHIVNEFHASYLGMDYRQEQGPIQASKDWGATQLGWLPAVDGNGFPRLNIGDFSSQTNGLAYFGYNTLGTEKDQSVGLGDDLTWITGRHTVRMGYDERRYEQNYYNDNNSHGGTYQFGGSYTSNGSTGGVNLAGLMLGEDTGYIGDPVHIVDYFRYHYYGTYIQDDYKVRHNLTMNIGLRWEFETPRMDRGDHQGTFLPNLPGTINSYNVTGGFCFTNSCGLSHMIWPPNYNGWEPRIGLAYSPKPNWTVRASYSLLRLPLTSVIGDAGGAQSDSPNLNVPGNTYNGQLGGTNPNAYSNLVTNPLVPPAVAPLYTTGGPYFAYAAIPVPYVPQDNSAPFAHAWTFDTQWQVRPSDMLEASYIGNHSGHLTGISSSYWASQFEMGLNYAPYSTLLALGEANYNFNPTFTNTLGIENTAVGNIPAESQVQKYAPYQQFFNDPLYVMFQRSYDSEYDALYLSWTHRTSHGLYFLMSFTWDKMLDDSPEENGSNSFFGGGTTPWQNPFNLRGEKAQSVNEFPLTFTTAVSYQLPLGRGKFFAPSNRVVEAVFGDWVTSTMFRRWAAPPIPVLLGSNGYFNSISPTDTSYGSYLPGDFALRPNLVPNVAVVNPSWRKDPLHNAYLNSAAFAVPGSLGAPALGDAPRTICCGPHVTNIDMSLRKRFPLPGEHRYFSLEADASNVFNHPQFLYNSGSGHSVYNAFNFASITNSSQPAFTNQSAFGFLNLTNVTNRVVQLGLRFVW